MSKYYISWTIKNSYTNLNDISRQVIISLTKYVRVLNNLYKISAVN